MASTRRTSAKPRNRSAGGFLLGVFVGLLAGLAMSLVIAFYLNKTPIPFVSSSKKTEEAAKAGKPPAIAGLPQTSGTTTEKQKFDFYKILPGAEEQQITDKELRERMRASRGGQQDASRDVYFIQAGSFQNPADADNQKARLAILGFESSVEPANLPDKGTWYRVRMGPYSKLEDINRIRQSLAQNGIDASLVKIKEPQ